MRNVTLRSIAVICSLSKLRRVMVNQVLTDAKGRATKPARLTVFHNGVLVQDNFELSGPTAHQERPPYVMHPDTLPLSLQDHGNPVRYRNIWIRPLSEQAP